MKKLENPYNYLKISNKVSLTQNVRKNIIKYRIIILYLIIFFYMKGISLVYKTSAATQTRKNNKRDLIIQTAAQIFAERGYGQTTIKNIVEKSHTSVGSFYFYFETKEALLEIIYDDLMNALESISDLAMKKVENVVDGFCRSKTAEMWFFEKNRGLAKALIVEAAGFNQVFDQKRSEIFAKSNARIEQIFITITAKGALKSTDPRLAAIICNGTMYSVIIDWLQGNGTNHLLAYVKPVIVYNLNALGIPYDEGKVDFYIQEMISEMEATNGLYLTGK